MTDGNRKSGDTSGLLGDLESIRTLLEQPGDSGQKPAPGATSRTEQDSGEEAAAPAGPAEGPGNDDEVPLLEDVVHGGVSLNETFLGGQGDFQLSTDDSGLNEDVFKALLSDEWRESARELLDQAREAIERHQTDWTPEHTDQHNEALKVRIDATLQQWLREALASRVGELRQTLLTALSDEIHTTIDKQFNSSHEDPDGE